jgi:short-subunit dehydrogenase
LQIADCRLQYRNFSIQESDMAIHLKNISEQVIVITGATSGIGLTTARMAARQGARLVLAARNIDALRQLEAELVADGALVLTVKTDVGSSGDVERLGAAALDRFGRIDTWINNAGISVYGSNEEVSLADKERLFQTNFWGVVNGSLQALKRMKKSGGAIINLGSELSDRAVPLQGMYSASKHAVKGFTDSLRMEIEKDGVPVAVTLIKPAGIDTMFTSHAKSYLLNEPELPAPLYAPEVVAQAILHAAQHPERDLAVGAASKLVGATAAHAPRLLDMFMKAFMFKQQQSDIPVAPGRSDALYAPSNIELQQRRGNRPAKVRESSVYTSLAMRRKPVAMALVVGCAALAAWKLGGAGGKGGDGDRRTSVPSAR